MTTQIRARGWVFFVFGSFILYLGSPEQQYILETDWGERVIAASSLPAYEKYNSALRAAKVDRGDEALALYEEALALKPDIPEALINYANLLVQRGDHRFARPALEAALAAADHPSLQAASLSNLGHLEQRVSGKDMVAAAKAEGYYRQALEADPNFVDALFNLGTLFDGLGRHAESAEVYSRVLALRPAHSTALLNLANAHFHTGDWTAAVAVQGRLASEADVPMSARRMGLLNMGQVYRSAGQHAQALATFEAVLKLSGEGQQGDAVAIASALQARRSLCSWRGYDRLQDDLAAATRLELAHLASVAASVQRTGLASPVPVPPSLVAWRSDDATKVVFGLSVQPYDALLMEGVSMGMQAEIASAHAMPFEAAGRVTGLICDALTNAGTSAATGALRLRVAYLSFDFREHPMGHLTAALVTGHSSPWLQAAAVSYGEDDSSNLRRRFEGHFKGASGAGTSQGGSFVDVHGMSDAGAADAMALLRPHILVDLMAHTRGTRAALAASRPGPLLVNYLGYPSTMGGAYCDAAVVDRVAVPPEAARGFTEKLVYVPHSYQANDYSLTAPLCSARPEYQTFTGHSRGGPFAGPGVSAARAAACLAHARASLLRGLADTGGPLLCNFNNVDKFEPLSFSAWMALLASHPAATLVLLDFADGSGLSETNLRAEAAARGVHPSRLVWARRVTKGEHLARLTGCDLVVDNFVYGAHTTASDALWAAVPLVSLRGVGGGGDLFGRMQSRVGASLLAATSSEAGGSSLGFLAAHAVKEFSDAASRLIASEGTRLGLRRRLAAAGVGSPLFDSADQVRRMEHAYACLWEVHQAAACDSRAVAPNGRLGRHIIVGDAPRPTASGTREAAAVRALEEALEKEGATAAAAAAAALAVSERLLSAFPRSADGWHLRGLAWHRNGSQADARRHVKAALSLLQNKGAAPFFWGNLATVEAAAGRSLHAAHALAAAVAFAPWDASSSALLLARLLASPQQPRDATAPFALAFGRWKDVWRGGPGARAASEGAVAAAVALRGQEAVTWLREALWVDPSNHAARLKLGAAIESLGRPHEAMQIFIDAVKAQHSDDFASYVARSGARSIVPPPGRARGETEARNVTRKGRVVIYCNEYGQTWWPRWGPRSVGSGLGGSEEAVVFLSREVAALGWSVEVYASPPLEDQRMDSFGVLWAPFEAYDVATPPDVFVAWRYHISAALALSEGPGSPAPRKAFVWLQDVPSFASWSPSFVQRLDGILTLSAFHSRQLPNHAISKCVVTPNGIDPAYFANGPNRHDAFVYGSAPNRGLETVLRCWPRIRAALPGATLRVFYGFSKSFVAHGRQHIPDFETWHRTMLSLLGQEGVTYEGMVNHTELAAGYAAAGFILYPTTFPETGCVTVMKAMAMGAIPVTSRFHHSTLPELTEPFDLGPQRPLSQDAVDPAADDPHWVTAWVEAVVEASRRDAVGGLSAHREAMKTAARRRFLWSSVARIWDGAFTSPK